MKKLLFFNEIENAYTWEGYAICNIKAETDSKLVLYVSGSSTVEHNGDEDGIKTQVEDLKYTEYKEDNITYRIISATVEITHGNRFDGGDYIVYTSGIVTLSKN